MKILKYEPSMKKKVQDVCISQSTSRFKDERAKLATLALYCDEYLDHEVCFVLVNDQDEICGYTLCATDLRKYDENMQPYLTKLKELDEEKYQRYFNTNLGYEPGYPEYPAHLHIDIKEEYTGGGNGTKLMQTLFAYLKEQGVPGIMVGVDPNNIRAVKFYHKMGFRPLDENIPSMIALKL